MYFPHRLDTEPWLVLRMKILMTGGGLGTNYGMIVSARGADKNIAIDIYGGCISGMAYKTQMIGWKSRTEEKQPTEYSESISRATGVLYVNTQLNWRTKEKDAKGNDVEYTKTSWDVKAIMPDMYPHDDGHTIKGKAWHRGRQQGVSHTRKELLYDT